MASIRPFLWFDGTAEQAAKFYVSIFDNSKILSVSGAGEQVMSVTFEVEGQELIAFNGGPYFQFTPAISLFVDCATQAELDRLWKRLVSKGGEPSRCGWLKDRFGVSWQLIPSILGDLLGDDDEEKAGRAQAAMMTMGKLDIAALKAAHAGAEPPARKKAKKRVVAKAR